MDADARTVDQGTCVSSLIAYAPARRGYGPYLSTCGRHGNTLALALAFPETGFKIHPLPYTLLLLLLLPPRVLLCAKLMGVGATQRPHLGLLRNPLRGAREASRTESEGHHLAMTSPDEHLSFRVDLVVSVNYLACAEYKPPSLLHIQNPPGREIWSMHSI
jgi:hypothetical protein